jgi:streptogramin lyase
MDLLRNASLFGSARVMGVIMLLILPLATYASDSRSDAVADIGGVVQDDEGAPIHAATVRAEDANSGIATSVLTDHQGRFTIPHLRPVKHLITASKMGYEAATTSDAVPSDRSLSFELASLPVIPLAQMRDSDIIKYMPDDDPEGTALGVAHVPILKQSDKSLVRNSCVRCHSLAKAVIQHRYTRGEWDGVLTRMQGHPVGSASGYNFVGGPEVKSRMLDYLTTYFGPGNTVAAEMERKAAEGYREENPLGHGVVYTEWKIPTPIAMPHTAVPDKRGRVWITLWAVGKIASLDVETGEFVEYPVKKRGGNPHGITVGPDGVVWYTIDGDLGRLDPATGTVEEFTPPPEAPVGLAIQVARNGMVWYSAPGGLGGFDPNTRQFRKVVAEKGMGSPYALIQSNQNEDVFWICVEGENRAGFVNIRTGEANILHTRSQGPKRPRVDSTGRVWFGYYEGGALGTIDPETMELTEYDLGYRASAYAVHVDDEDYVWASSFERSSLIRFDPRTEEMLEHPWASPRGIVRDIWPDADGNMWFVHFAYTHNSVVRVERAR